ncbi:MAG: CPBP family intramembrane glutamic endopeptidase [Nocardioidaceae bacterium]
MSELPPEAWAFPHAEPTPYHLMLRTWTYSWWRPVVGVLLAVVSFFIGASLVYLVVNAVWALFQSGAWQTDLTRDMDPQHVGPPALLGLNLGIASMIPVTWLIMRFVHRMRPRWLASVVPKLRWRFLGVCLGLALVALVAQLLVGSLIPGGSGEDPSGSLNSLTVSTALSALVVLLTTPLQAAGEEYLFRGYLLAAFGSFFGSRWVAILATATLFALAHGTQNAPLFLDRFAFGLIAGWLVTRTGGLEAGIALHVLNNFLAFGLALAFGDLSSTLNVSEVGWWNIALTVTQSGVYTLLVVLVARRMGLQTSTRPPVGDGPARFGGGEGDVYSRPGFARSHPWGMG